MRLLGKIRGSYSNGWFIHCDDKQYLLAKQYAEYLIDAGGTLDVGDLIAFDPDPSGKFASNASRIVKRFNPNDESTEGEKKLLETLIGSNLLRGWTIFEEPHINGKKPDIVLVHPLRGVIIIEVKDWDLNSGRYQNRSVIDDYGRVHVADPVDQVTNEMNNLAGMSFLIPGQIYDRSFKYVCERIVYFHGSDRKQVLEFCGAKDKEPDPESKKDRNASILIYHAEKGFNDPFYIWTDEELDRLQSFDVRIVEKFPGAEDRLPFILNNVIPYYYNRFEDKKLGLDKDEIEAYEIYMRRIMACLAGSEYEEDRKEPFTLNAGQQQSIALPIEAPVRFITANSGTGKSVALAHLAAQLALQDKRVLLLTHNITARNYMMELSRQQAGKLEREQRKKYQEKLTVDYYHNLLSDYRKYIPLKAYADLMSTYTGSDEMEYDEQIEQLMEYTDDLQHLLDCMPVNPDGYDYVLVDDGEKFRHVDLLFLKNKVCGESAKLVYVYDKKMRELLYNDEDGDYIASYSGSCENRQLTQIMSFPEEIGRIADVLMGEKEASSIELPDAVREKLIWIINSPNDDEIQIADSVTDYVRNRVKSSFNDYFIITSGHKMSDVIFKKFSEEGIGIPAVACKKARASKNAFWGGKGKIKIAECMNFQGWHNHHVIVVLDDKIDNDLTLVTDLKRIVKGENGDYSFTCLDYSKSGNKYDLLKAFFTIVEGDDSKRQPF